MLILDCQTERAAVHDGASLVEIGRDSRFLEFCLYCISRGDPVVAPADLLRLTGWENSREMVVRKQMRRYVRKLDQLGAKSIVEPVGGVTASWRLAAPRQEIVFRPSRQACLAWVTARISLLPTQVAALASSVPAWLPGVAQGIIAWQCGRTSEALAAFADVQTAANGPFEAALADYFLQRVAGREPTGALDGLEGPLRQAMQSRIRIHEEIQDRSNIAESVIALEALARRLRSLPDLDGLAAAHNALAVQYLRHDGGAARQSATRAIAMSLVTLNLPLFQAATFNFANAHFRLGGHSEAAESRILLLEVDRRIARDLNIGHDSAQAEILLAEICESLGDAVAAVEWLDAARAAANLALNEYDRACVTQLEARIVWNEAFRAGNTDLVRAKALDLLARAECSFRALGRLQQTASDRRSVGRGLPIAIKGGPTPSSDSSDRSE